MRPRATQSSPFKRRLVALAAITALVACSDDPVDDVEDGSREDAAAQDAASEDASSVVDAAADATADATVDAAVDAAEPDAALDGGQDAGNDGGVVTARPNILLIVADDLGYSDIGAFGGEIHTPNLDTLAAEGRILTDHHSGFTCAPTRSMLISGTDHHLVGLGRMGAGTGPQAGQPGYEGYLNDKAISVAEILRDNGYHTYIAGKWHLGSTNTQTPLHRGYESSYVLLPGVWTHFREFADPPTTQQSQQFRENGAYVIPPADYYATDFFTDRLISYIEANRADGKPFYAFAAYTSPHWPMQAPAAFVNRYRGVYDAGYDAIAEARLERQKALGIIPEDFVPNPGLDVTPARPSWAELTEAQRANEARRMEVYAAMVENLDHNIGRLIQYLKRKGEYENTFIWFQSDNGPESGRNDRASANNTLENIGHEGSYVGVGLRWAEVSATPFKLFKSYSAEGGHSVPALVRLPNQHASIERFDGLTHLTDLVPTFLELAGVPNPGTSYNGRTVHAITGRSLLPALDGRAQTVRGENDVLADEQNGHRYVIRGRWKLLWLAAPYALETPGWQLFDLVADRGETTDVASQHPDVVTALEAEWTAYVARVGVILAPGGGGGGGGGG